MRAWRGCVTSQMLLCMKIPQQDRKDWIGAFGVTINSVVNIGVSSQESCSEIQNEGRCARALEVAVKIGFVALACKNSA